MSTKASHQPKSSHFDGIRLLSSSIAWLLTTIYTLFFGVIAIILGFLKQEEYAHNIGRLWAWCILKTCRSRVIIKGQEHLRQDRALIIVANHQSLFDIIACFVGLPIQFRWLAKASLFQLPIMGRGMAGCGYIPVQRDHKKKKPGDKRPIKSAQEKIAQGYSVLIFPEGTRSLREDQQMLPFKLGAFKLAKDTNTAIQAITISGTRQITPKQPGKLVQRLYPGTVTVQYHPVIEPETFQALTMESLSQQLRTQIESALSES